MIPELLRISHARIADVCRRHGIRELSLFGSQARGDSNESSDYDFLVEFSPDTKVGFIELGFIREELETIVRKRVDLVSKNGLKEVIRNEVLSSSLVVYAE